MLNISLVVGYLSILVFSVIVDMRITAAIITLSIIYWFMKGEKAFGTPIHNWLVKYDWAWIAPIGVFAFVGIGWFFQDILNLAIGTYDLAFLQPILLALVASTLFFSGATLFLRFNWWSLFKYWMGDDDPNPTPGIGINMFGDIKSLTPWQRLLLLYALLFSYVGVTVLVYLALV